MRYRQQKDGDRIRPRRKNYKIQCCDCGLVHSLNFRLVRVGGGKYPKHSIEFTATRDVRATAAARRKKSLRKVKRAIGR